MKKYILDKRINFYSTIKKEINIIYVDTNVDGLLLIFIQKTPRWFISVVCTITETTVLKMFVRMEAILGHSWADFDGTFARRWVN